MRHDNTCTVVEAHSEDDCNGEKNITLRRAVEACARLGCIRVFWGALLPCRLTTDGREWCATCLAKAAVAKPEQS